MNKELGTIFTIGEYNRLMKNLQVYEKLNDEQKEWLEYYMDKYNHNLKKVALKINEGILWVIINTGNSVKEFSKE